MFNQLCAPAKFYLVMSIVYYILILLQNIGSHDRFYLGSYSCSHSNPGILLLINGIYVLLWTWLLNLICGINKTISWIIVFFPIFVLFISFGIILMRGIKLDDMKNN